MFSIGLLLHFLSIRTALFCPIYDIKDPWISPWKRQCLTLHEEGARESAGCWFRGRVAWRVPIVVGSAGWWSINLGNESPFSFACCLHQRISRSMTLQEAGTKGTISTTSIPNLIKLLETLPHSPYRKTEQNKTLSRFVQMENQVWYFPVTGKNTENNIWLLCVLSWVWLLYSPMDCNPPGPTFNGIFHARILEWVAISSSRGSSRLGDWTHVSYISCISKWILCHWTTWGVDI